MFTAPPPEAKVVNMQSFESPFEQALRFDDQNSEKAVEFYWKAIEAGDCTADAYCNLGILESEREDFIQAIDSFTNCLKYDPRHFEAHYNLANVYSEVGNLSLSKVHYELSIKIEPEFESAYYNLGLVMALQKDYKGAVEMLQEYRPFASDREKEKVDKLIQNIRKSMTATAAKK